MKKVIWIVVVVLVVLFISGSCSAYNRMVTAEETVNTTWADVEAQYQRRSDLIPNLVNTVKGYAAHEQSTFTEVVEARAQAMSFKLDAADLTPEKLAEFQQAQQKVGSALGRLIAVAERYPDLKANQNFLELQAQLEGTENRIAVARTRFNDATRQYNVTIRRFPANLIAGMFGFAPGGAWSGETTYYLLQVRWEWILAIPAALPVKPWLEGKLTKADTALTRGVLLWGPKLLAGVLLALSILRLLSATFTSFLYFQF